MSNNLTAYCYRDGKIEFTESTIPEGTLPIASHEDHHALRAVVDVMATHGYEKGLLLVPGLRTLQEGQDPVDVLCQFKKQVEDRLPTHRLLPEYGCAVLVEDGVLLAIPLLAIDGMPDYGEDGEIEWSEVVAPESQDFLDKVNAMFNTSFRVEDFPGR